MNISGYLRQHETLTKMVEPADSSSSQIAYSQSSMSISDEDEVEPLAKSLNLASKASFAKGWVTLFNILENSPTVTQKIFTPPLDGHLLKPYNSSDALITELSNIPSLQPLFEEARKTLQDCQLPPLKIQLEQPNGNSCASQEGNIIRIGVQPPSAQRYSVIFELNNVIHEPKFREIKKSAAAGAITEEDYVRAFEFIEYNGLRRAVALSQEINKQKSHFFHPYITTGWENVAVEKIDFELFYNNYLDPSHKDYYRKYWRLMHPSAQREIDHTS